MVSQAKSDGLRQFLARNPKPFAVVGDPTRGLYRAAGLDRVGLLSFFKPRVLGGYAAKILHGRRIRSPYEGEDVLQRGGDGLATRAGELAWMHASRDAMSRPAVGDVLEAADALLN